MVEFAIAIYTEIINICMPIAIVFGLGNMIVSTVLNAAFGGRLWVGK